MKDGRPESSDSIRSGEPLRHLRRVRFDELFPLELGGALDGFEVAYETWGALDTEASNAVLVCHAISGDSHAARHDEEDQPGWWDVVIGPGQPIDTDRWFVLCPNVLGGCRGSTGPSSPDPATGEPYGADFPEVTVADMVACQARLLDHLGIERLHSVAGGSLGGHQALAWAKLRPERVESVMAIATSPRLTSQATAFDVVGRNAITASEEGTGLAIARMLGHVTYLSRESMAGRFDADRLDSVTSYLEHQGARFVERFDPESYVKLSLAMDRFDLDPRALPGTCRWLVVSFSSDWLFPPEQSREIVAALAPAGARVAYCEVTSHCGHDAFLLRDDVEVYGELMRGFLAPDGAESQPLSAERERIAELVPPGASVLDAGCGGGELLAHLRARGSNPVAGIESEERAVVRAVGRGLGVIHAEPAAGLEIFDTDQFDLVVLARELHRAPDVERLLREALRVGRRTVASFENAAFHARAQRLAKEGRGAEAWHDGPASRALTIQDLTELATSHGLRLEQLIGLDAEGRLVPERAEILADVAIVVLASG